MAVALSIVDIDNSGKSMYVTVRLAISGTYATGGDTIDLTTVAGQGRLGRVFIASALPLYASLYGTNGYSFGWVPGTTLANGKVKVSTTAATELTAGAYPAGITSDPNIFGTFIFDQLL